MRETIRVSPIKSVSPTLAETLRQCKLRAGLSRAENSNRFVLGNPKAWLGTAYHAVLEQLGPEHRDDVEKGVKELWDTAIEARHERSRAHQLDKRFGYPQSWPGYYRIAAMALARAKQLIAAEAGLGRSRRKGETGRLREGLFSGAHGKLVGRPDVVRQDEIADFKTGNVFEEGESAEVKPEFVRQLRLYAFLVKETLGWWPRRGVLLPMAGPQAELVLQPEECETEAQEAVRLLDEYNEVVGGSRAPIELASASPANCRWCGFQLCCPAFWGAVEPAWKEGLRTDAVAGRAEGASRIHGGAALSLSLEVASGTAASGELVSLAPLRAEVHLGLSKVQRGDRLRVTGLARRPDDSLAVAKRTTVAIAEALPLLEIESGL